MPQLCQWSGGVFQARVPLHGMALVPLGKSAAFWRLERTLFLSSLRSSRGRAGVERARLKLHHPLYTQEPLRSEDLFFECQLSTELLLMGRENGGKCRGWE
ncbi:cation transport regulator-like protein 1 [Platysternon megacephalum]|uniref:Cation transport regulator-like protein 1 n=1 Tax=Platysternon megacephalum TaxID=55544 RepID=A0A4D9FBX6_9SAUR|nr:cation transport regulator-like protein 1 [Platysternon megacephalum]